ncbi:hypothetical protein ACJX0J_025772 [Zea mays]
MRGLFFSEILVFQYAILVEIKNIIAVTLLITVGLGFVRAFVSLFWLISENSRMVSKKKQMKKLPVSVGDSTCFQLCIVFKHRIIHVYFLSHMGLYSITSASMICLLTSDAFFHDICVC